MNIFVLDENANFAARYHCDKHVVKMVLETAQIMSTVAGGPYKPTHQNHPCTLWAAESQENWEWLSWLGLSLATEYRARYGRTHKSEAVIRECIDIGSPATAISRTPHVLAMPEQYHSADPVEAYRSYYIGEKRDMLTYRHTDTPEWLASVV